MSIETKPYPPDRDAFCSELTIGYSGSEQARSDSLQPTHRLTAVQRGVLAMHAQGEPNELIAIAFGLPVLQVRNMIAEHSRASDVGTEDALVPMVRRVPRKNRHPDRCKGCGALLTIKPCVACYARAWPG